MKRYREDIDGLRAFAVLAVIVHHADPFALASGYLGVDIFFVISGYVIALSLMGREDRSLGVFLKHFYTRRVKRLMPALIVCIAVSSVVFAIIDPNPTISLHTGVAALLGVSNIYLYFQQLDYFATDISFNAFTHTWSLGIEEQFYLVLPTLLWATTRGNCAQRDTRPFWTIALVSLFSFGLFVILRQSQPLASFYLLHTRFWQLGAGILLALSHHARSPSIHARPAPVRRIGWQGVFLIALIGGMTLQDMDDRLLTILTVAFTLLVIAAPDRSWLAGNSIAAYLGRISYSLYLWHWPLLVFEAMAPRAMWSSPTFLIVLFFGSSIASYHLVERPLRRKAWSLKSRRDALYGLMASAAAIAFLLVLPMDRIRPLFIPEHNRFLERPYLPLPTGGSHAASCVIDERRRLLEATTFDNCTFAPERDRSIPTIWAIGDSHAGHFQGMLSGLHHDLGLGIHLVEIAGQHFPPSSGQGSPSRRRLMEDIRAQMRPGDVVLLSRLYLTRTNPTRIMDGVIEDWIAAVEPFLREMSERSVTVVIPGPPPIFTFDDIRACDRDRPASCGVPRDHLIRPISEIHAALETLATRHGNLRILKIFDILCPNDQRSCTPVRNGVFTMRDRDHLNVYGAKLLTEDFLKLIRHGSWHEHR